MNAKFDHILVIDEWHRNEYAGLEGRELWRSESGQSWNWQKYNDNPRKWTPPTQAIKLYSQCNTDNKPGEEHLKNLYALDVRMTEEISMKNIEQAEANVKRIKAIQKKFEAMCEKYGRPETFTQFAAYIADAIGAKLAVYSSISGDYVEASIEELKYKERKLLNPNE